MERIPFHLNHFHSSKPTLHLQPRWFTITKVTNHNPYPFFHISLSLSTRLVNRKQTLAPSQSVIVQVTWIYSHSVIDLAPKEKRWREKRRTWGKPPLPNHSLLPPSSLSQEYHHRTRRLPKYPLWNISVTHLHIYIHAHTWICQVTVYWIHFPS